MKTLKQILEAFKEVPTHSKSGKPNANHPAYAKHQAAYDAERKAALAASKKERTPKEGPDLDKIFYDLTGIISQFFPDGDPADYFPKYYRANGINYDIARKAFKKHGYKDEYDYISSMGEDMGYAEDMQESVEPLEELSKSTVQSYQNKAKKDIRESTQEVANTKTTSFKNFVSIKNTEEVNEATGMPEDHGFKMGMTHHKITKAKYDSELSKMEKTPSNGTHKRTTNMAHENGVHMKQIYSHKSYNHPSLVKITDAKDKVHHYMKPPAKNESMEESVFDWKNKKSEIDWKNDDDKPTTSKEGGTVHKAREKSRNAEVGGNAPKKNVGRPAGEYQGGYKIDKAKRDTPEYKAELSKKVMAAKAENFKVRDEFKSAMDAAIKKRQLAIAGIN